MKKFTKLSLIASTAILGTALLTGCGSSSSNEATASTDGSAEIQGSVVNNVTAGGMTLFFDDNTTCTNDSNISTTGTTLTLNATAFQGCEKPLNTYKSISVDTTKSYAVENVGDENATLFSNKVGTKPFKGVAGKKVNIFSSIAVEKGVDVEDIDVNNAGAAIKALKELIQAQIAANPTKSVADFSDINISKVAAATSDSVDLNISDIGISTANLATVLGVTASEFDTISTAMKNNSSASFTELVESGDINITAITTLISLVKAQAELPMLSLGSTLSVGDQNITVGNGTFSHAITTVDEDNSSNNLTTLDFFDIKFPTVSLINELDSTVTVGLSVNIENDNNQSVTLKVDGAQLKKSTDDNSSVTVTLPEGTKITASQTGLSTLNSIIGTSSSATTSTELVNSDFSFNVQTLLDELDNNNITNAISELDKFLLAQGSYDVNITLTDLNQSVLKTAYTSIIGTVLVNMSDENIVASAKAALTVASETATNLTLPITLNGATISWATNNASVLSAAGVVTEVSEDTNVTLTATITKGTETDTKEFTVTVKNDPFANTIVVSDLNYTEGTWSNNTYGIVITNESNNTVEPTNLKIALPSNYEKSTSVDDVRKVNILNSNVKVYSISIQTTTTTGYVISLDNETKDVTISTDVNVDTNVTF
jgi:hypothetical protein